MKAAPKSSVTAYPEKPFSYKLRVFVEKYAYRTAVGYIWLTHFPLALTLLYRVCVEKDLDPVPDYLLASVYLGTAVATLAAHILNTTRAGKHCSLFSGFTFQFLMAASCFAFRLKRADQFTYARAIDKRLLNMVVATFGGSGAYLEYVPGDGLLLGLWTSWLCVVYVVAMANAGGPGQQKFFNQTI